MSKIERIYKRLCAFSVLKDLTQNQLIKSFFDFAKSKEQDESLKVSFTIWRRLLVA